MVEILHNIYNVMTNIKWVKGQQWDILSKIVLIFNSRNHLDSRKLVFTDWNYSLEPFFFVAKNNIPPFLCQTK